ncbi:MAG: hypothetical protein ACF8R7_12990 [Phycisphaerales bacterium JB039]
MPFFLGALPFLFPIYALGAFIYEGRKRWVWKALVLVWGVLYVPLGMEWMAKLVGMVDWIAFEWAAVVTMFALPSLITAVLLLLATRSGAVFGVTCGAGLLAGFTMLSEEAAGWIFAILTWHGSVAAILWWWACRMRRRRLWPKADRFG